MEITDSLFAEKIENHISFLEICLNIFNIKPVEDKDLIQRLIKTNNNYLDIKINETPKPSSQIQQPIVSQPNKLKINDDDDNEDEEEEY